MDRLTRRFVFGALLVLLTACVLGCRSRSAGTTPECGDGVAQGQEECDGDDLRGETCLSLGAYELGDLRCLDTCRYDRSVCLWDVFCGDGSITEGWEDCEPNDHNGETCENRGFVGGLLVCEPSCKLDDTWCSNYVCANRVDDNRNGSVDCEDPRCSGRFGCPLEVCGDGEDNDLNGQTDCEDVACAQSSPACNGGCYPTENSVFGLCSDGVDNDCDGVADASDLDCLAAPTILLAFDANGPPLWPADRVVFALTVVAASELLDTGTISVSLDPFFTEVEVLDGGLYDDQAHTVTWTAVSVPPHTPQTVHFAARLDAQTPGGEMLCAQAEVDFGQPWLTDDPDVPGDRDPTCVVVNQ